MDDRFSTYLQRALDFEAMAKRAETDQLRRAYEELARGYRLLAQHAGKLASVSATAR
jgi:hypothetical protein